MIKLQVMGESDVHERTVTVLDALKSLQPGIASLVVQLTRN